MPTTGRATSMMKQGVRAALGREARNLATPALLLDLAVLQRNIGCMAERTQPGQGARLRAHVKSHKCVEIARMQIAAGALGLTTATLWEAAVMADAGLDDLLIANQIVGEEKIRVLAEIARKTRITVAVDALENIEDLGAAAREARSEIGVVPELDVGLKRCGLRTADEVVDLSRRILKVPGVELRGITGYEGPAVLEPNREIRTASVNKSMRDLVAGAEKIRAAGLPCEIVSAGGTGTYDLTKAYPGVTEIQAGSYVFMDVKRMEFLPDFDSSLTVLATVLSRQGDTLVLDCGKKTVGIDYAMPKIKGETIKVRSVAEEHTLFDIDSSCKLKAGECVEVIPGYCPTTINLHDVFYVVENGIVSDIWPVVARGPGRGGLY